MSTLLCLSNQVPWFCTVLIQRVWAHVLSLEHHMHEKDLAGGRTEDASHAFEAGRDAFHRWRERSTGKSAKPLCACKRAWGRGRESGLKKHTGAERMAGKVGWRANMRGCNSMNVECVKKKLAGYVHTVLLYIYITKYSLHFFTLYFEKRWQERGWKVWQQTNRTALSGISQSEESCSRQTHTNSWLTHKDNLVKKRTLRRLGWACVSV